MRTLALAVTLLTAPEAAAAKSLAPERGMSPARPRIEVAFVLDTTGSMSGLIEGAKRRIWSIAERIGDGRPRPDLRIALVGYRDVGDDYVARVHDLTSDMDLVHERLMSFEAGGGGDTPEHVSAALAAAVRRISWSRGRALRIIFLVGDAPPHVDYQDGLDYRRHVREALQRGITVEAIQCGADPATTEVWSEIAALGGGHFARIDAQGGMPVRVTPVDAELARLNAELAATVVAGGSARERAEASRRVAARAAMPAPMAVEAASYYAKAGRLAERDLVDLPAEAQKKELDALRARGDAPEALAGRSDGEALAYLQEQKARRARIQARILALQRERQAHLRKAGGSPSDGFDAQVVENLRARAAEIGVRY